MGKWEVTMKGWDSVSFHSTFWWKWACVPVKVLWRFCLGLYSASNAKKRSLFPFSPPPTLFYSLQRFSGDGDDVLRRGLHSRHRHGLLLHHRPRLLSVGTDENHRRSAGWEWCERPRTQPCFAYTQSAKSPPTKLYVSFFRPTPVTFISTKSTVTRWRRCQVSHSTWAATSTPSLRRITFYGWETWEGPSHSIECIKSRF